MMRRVVWFIFLTLFISGCTSLQIPAYIQDKKPYTQRFYGKHAEVVEAVKKSLGAFGWKVEGTSDPAVYEAGRIQDPGSENVLMFTEVRQTPMFLWTTYRRINVFVGSKNNVSDVEIRYTKINSFPFKQFKKYRNDRLVKRIFQRVNEELNQPQP